ncbi:MAG TPA: RT0821/Lpp0805 family surface protein [Coxiellaceae bacterium]|nr:RT0821/Lpp0805 family surface protein [Coxiellaceae bacterium]
MNKMLSTVAALAVSAALVVGCETKEGTGTLVGATGGAAIGSQFGHGEGRLLGAAVGALLGGFMGNRIGASMDAKDQANMQNAIVTTPVGSQAQWTNAQTGRTYTVTPVNEASTSDGYCREYQTTVTVGGQVQKAYGKACRQPDGQWKLMNN